MTPNNKTVLFVFALSAALEADRKPVFGNHKKNTNQQFFKLLNTQTKRIAQESGVAVVWIDETKQQGATFAERYANAFQQLFDQGYENVVSIGNDSPELTATHISKAIKALAEKDLVFGPSEDGGVYLLGYSKNAFDKKNFEKFSWLTSTLSAEIGQIAQKNDLKLEVLETLADIDHLNNAIGFAYKQSNSVIATFILLHNTAVKKSYTHYSTHSFGILTTHSFLLRGPPSL